MLRPSSTQRPASSRAGHPRPKNKQDRNTTSPTSREADWNYNSFTDTPKHTTRHSPAHQKDKIQPHPPEHRHQTPPPGSLQNTLNQSYRLGAETNNNRNYEPAACERDPTHIKLSKMRRQRNTQQMKEQGKNPPDQRNEEEIGSLPRKEFRVMIVKMFQNLGNRMEKIQETFNKDLEELKSKQWWTTH